MQPVQQSPVIHFEIPYTRFLDPFGKITQVLPDFATDPHYLIDLYTAMLRNRVFDSKAINLQRTGRLGTYASTLGQEAIGVGIGAAMRAEDVFCPYYRDYGAQFWRGVQMEEILAYWGGDERGSQFQDPSGQQDFPICVPIASQTLHAVGVGLAIKLRKQPRVAVATIGDGGTSRGDFYEAMNVAGAMKLPVVFVINNNQWAISVPRSAQTAAETLAQKGIAAGIASEQIDGNDVVAVRYAVGKAIENARLGGGSCLIEALTYRTSDHTTADDARRYRDLSELEAHRNEDPIKRLFLYLTQELKVWDEAKEQAAGQAASEVVAAAVERYQNLSPREPASMFDHLYAELPEAYVAQRAECIQSSLTKTKQDH